MRDDDIFTEAIDGLSSEDPSVRRTAIEQLAEHRDSRSVSFIINRLGDSNKGVQQAAIDALIVIRGEGVVYNLAPLLREESATIRNMAVEILSKIGNDGMHFLIPLLRDSDDDVRKFVVDIFGMLGNPIVNDYLIEMMDDRNPNVRSSAITSLGLLKCTKAIKRIIEAIRADLDWVKFAAIEAIDNIADIRSIPFLLDVFRTSDNDLILVAIVEALSHLGDKTVIPALLSRIDSPNVMLRNTILGVIIDFAGKVDITKIKVVTESREQFIRYLKENAESEDTELVIVAIRGFEYFNDRKTIPLLIDLAKHHLYEGEISAALKSTLIKIAGPKELINQLDVDGELEFNVFIVDVLTYLDLTGQIDRLVEFSKLVNDPQLLESLFALIGAYEVSGYEDYFITLLNSEYANVRIAGAKLLSRLVSRKALPHFVELFRNDLESEVKIAALTAIVGSGDTPTIRDLLSHLAEFDPEVRSFIANSIYDIREDWARGYLDELLRDTDPAVRRTAVKTLSRYADRQALSDIIQTLNDESDQVKIAAVESLKQFPSRDTAQPLITMLQDGNVWVRYRVAEALGGSRDAPEVVRALVKALKSETVTPVIIALLRSITMLGDRESIEAVSIYTSSTDPNIKKQAEDAVAAIVSRNGSVNG